MIKNVFLVGMLLIGSFVSCKTTKSQKNASAITYAGAIQEKKIPEPKPYMSSYVRLSDIIHTKLDLKFDWDSCFVLGTATITARPYFHASKLLVLDAKGFKINKVLMADLVAVPLKYEYDGRKLKIDLGRMYTRDQLYTIVIDYVAMPNKLKSNGSAAISSDKGLYFINPQSKEKYKPRQFWSQGETEANSCWFPTIEATNERFSQEVYLTVDTSMVTLSNGLLKSSKINKDGTRTDYWKQDLPHAPYLTMIAAGNFTVVKDMWRAIEVSYYMEPEYAKYVRLIFGKTPEMIEFFSNKLGVAYPWDKYAQIIVRDFVSGAMENTTAVTFYDGMNMTDRDYLDDTREDIVAHELFHHWFGDLVTAESWPNLPLNESFATYGEYLWSEYKYGREEADKAAQNDLGAYLTSSQQSQVDLIRFDVEDREAMFDNNSYQKGGRVLHMLRKYTGDEVFFESLKLYLERYKFQPVEIHQLRLAFEEVSGEDLNWFFNQWFLASGHPNLIIDYTYDDVLKKAKVSISQNQDFSKTPLYKLPLAVDIYVDDKAQREQIVITKAKETFEFNVHKKPQLINVDAEKMLVCTKQDKHSTEEWVYMYSHAPLYLDRYEALEGIAKFKGDQVDQVIMQALKDKHWSIRSQALGKLNNLSVENREKVYSTIVDLALNDLKSSVRSRAITTLDASYAAKNNTNVLEKATNDSSYSVVAAVLRAYAKKEDKSQAYTLAQANQNASNVSISLAIADFYASYGDASTHPFFINYLEKTSGISKSYILFYYKNYLKRMDDNQIQLGVDVLKGLVLSTNNSYFESSAKGVLGDLLANTKSEEVKTHIKKVMDEIDAKNK